MKYSPYIVLLKKRNKFIVMDGAHRIAAAIKHNQKLLTKSLKNVQ